MDARKNKKISKRSQFIAMFDEIFKPSDKKPEEQK